MQVFLAHSFVFFASQGHSLLAPGPATWIPRAGRPPLSPGEYLSASHVRPVGGRLAQKAARGDVVVVRDADDLATSPYLVFKEGSSQDQLIFLSKIKSLFPYPSMI